MRKKQKKTMKKLANKIMIILSALALLIVCAWFGLMSLHAYRRAHFPSWITLIRSPQYESAAWRINGKEYGLHECPPVPGYIIDAERWDKIQIKEELGLGIYILYNVDSFFTGSEMRFMNYPISRIDSNNPLEYIEHWY